MSGLKAVWKDLFLTLNHIPGDSSNYQPPSARWFVVSVADRAAGSSAKKNRCVRCVPFVFVIAVHGVPTALLARRSSEPLASYTGTGCDHAHGQQNHHRVLHLGQEQTMQQPVGQGSYVRRHATA
jgi:hypothetical protein